MSLIIERKISTSFIFVLIIFLALAVGISVAVQPLSFIVLPVILMIFLFLFKFEVAFPIFLAIRSSLDVFTNVGIYIGPMNLNVPAGLSLFIDLVGLTYLGFNFALMKQVTIDRIGKAFFLWLALLVFWVFLAYYNFGTQGLVGLREWVRLFSLFIIYILTLQLARSKGFNYVINWLFLSLPIPLTVGFYQLIFHKGRIVGGVHRIFGTFAHPNNFALYLVLFIGLTIWKLKSAKKKLFWLLLLLAEVIALVNTFSVGGLVMAVTLFIFIFLKEVRKRKKRLYLVAIVVIAMFTGFLFLQSRYGQMRIEELKRTPSLSEVIEKETVTNSFTWRVVHWKLLIDEWREKPLLGYGLHTSGDFVSPWHAEPHNDYIRFLAETGLVGLIIFLGFLVIVGRKLIRKYRSSTNHLYKSLIFITISIFLSWIIGSTVGNHITTTGFHFYFWSLLAAINVGSKLS